MRSKKFPSFSQWTQIFKVLKKGERTFFLALVVLALISATYLATVLYLNSTKEAPAYRGSYIEGVVGQPRFINPVYGETNDIDRALIDLIYSGLMAYDKEGNITEDLVQNYQVSEDGKTYTFNLKPSIEWQDGTPLTADDVVFTIKTIQNSAYKSPLRANWLDVQVEKFSDSSFAFHLNSPYNSFLENCTVKIIPQHIWKNVLAENFALSSYNLQPVGSGLYAMSGISQTNSGFIKNISLKSNTKYYGKVPFISSVSFSFFENKEDLIKAANQKAIDGFSMSALDGSEPPAASKKFNVYSFAMPRYFAVFFNMQKSRILADSNIAKALSYSVDKQALAEAVKTLENEKISVVDSPILPGYFGFNSPETAYGLDAETAGKLLDKSGYTMQENGQRAKPNNKKPSFQFKSYLKIGSSGNEVIELQGCLAKLDESFKELLENETNGKFGQGTDKAVTEFQKKYLPDSTPTGEAGPSTRKKLNELCFAEQGGLLPLSINLVTINQSQLVKTANLLKDYWQKIGATVNLKIVEFSELKEIIKGRDYDALLYGQALGSSPDLYPFWHSTQINDPGLNLSAYQNKNADKLLKEARETQDLLEKKQKYEELQEVILKDAPALFLYNPEYLYWASDKVKGIDTTKIVDPAKRFSNIENWYINTRRVWK